MAQLLLKARPTLEQLRDRVESPVPDGLELYLDRLDLVRDDWRDSILANVAAIGPPRGFTWIVEAPIRTLNDRYFDLGDNDADHRETLKRVVEVGRDLGAAAANIHVVSPTLDVNSLTRSQRQQDLERATLLLSFYVELCSEAGLIPQVENVPPVGRMRENAYVFSTIGSAPRDLLFLADYFPSLRFTVDTSHAGLYLNWQKVDEGQVEPEYRKVVEFHREVDEIEDLSEFLGRLLSKTTTVHVSNARGLLGEGLLFSEGDQDLDRDLRPLVEPVPYFVTETLESDPRIATGMRDAQRRLRKIIDSVGGAAA